MIDFMFIFLVVSVVLQGRYLEVYLGPPNCQGWPCDIDHYFNTKVKTLSVVCILINEKC